MLQGVPQRSTQDHLPQEAKLSLADFRLGFRQSMTGMTLDMGDLTKKQQIASTDMAEVGQWVKSNQTNSCLGMRRPTLWYFLLKTFWMFIRVPGTNGHSPKNHPIAPLLPPGSSIRCQKAPATSSEAATSRALRPQSFPRTVFPKPRNKRLSVVLGAKKLDSKRGFWRTSGGKIEIYRRKIQFKGRSYFKIFATFTYSAASKNHTNAHPPKGTRLALAHLATPATLKKSQETREWQSPTRKKLKT